ncbi:MAG: DNA polymerase III subunit delta' [Leptolyngbya sp. SIO1E4]|nr:DNA polymerase III subunit delta' [Leptolyngbya sp. SIO1E4]
MVRDTFTGLLGQDTAVDLLCQAIAQQRIAPAYLFAGPAGVGRRLAALRFAEPLLGALTADITVLRRRIETRNHPDLLWVEPTYLHQGKPITLAAAEELGVRRKSPPQIRLVQVREITHFLARPPLESPRAVVIIEGAETMAEAAANGLLKTLEEPGQASLILLAPDSAALLPTLVSRCQQIPFRRLSQERMAAVLTAAGYPEVLQQPDILAMAQGSPGQAIAAWQQLQTLPEELIGALQQPPQSLRQALDLARRVSKELDTEAQLWLVDYLQQYYWQHLRSPALVTALESARSHLRRFVQPRLVWEVTLMALVP